MDEAHFRRLERMYASAPINRFYQPRLRIERGRAEVVIPLRAEMHHAAHTVHGSVIFKALDDAAFFAANSLVPDVFLVTASFHLHFIRAAREGDLTAVGTSVHGGKRQWVAEAVATDAEGREVARGSGTFVPTSVPLDARVGYG